MTATKTPDPLRIMVALLVALFITMGFTTIPGCASTPEDPNGYRAFVLAGEARVTALKTLVVLNDAELIDVNDYDKIEAFIDLTGAALRMWEDALEKGEDPTEYENLFYDNYETFREIRKKSNKPKRPNT